MNELLVQIENQWKQCHPDHNTKVQYWEPNLKLEEQCPQEDKLETIYNWERLNQMDVYQLTLCCRNHKITRIYVIDEPRIKEAKNKGILL